MVPISGVAKTETYTRAYADQNGFLTLLSDGERLTGAYALGPGGRRVAAAGHPRHPCARADRRAAGHDPAVSHLLRDLRRGAQDPATGDRYAPPGRRGSGDPLSAREPELLGQTVVVLGGSAGIGLETARRARAEGAEVVITGRDPERLENAARDVGARGSAAFDAGDPDALERFFEELPQPVDHVMVTAGRPDLRPPGGHELRADARRPQRALMLRSRSPATPTATCDPAGR